MYSNNSNKRNVPPFIKAIARGIFFFFFAALFMLLLGFVVMWLWNAILPDAVNANPIGYWEAIGLLVLSRILFGSFWFGKDRHRRHRRKRAYWRQKWMNMSEEERIAFKAKWKEQCRTRMKPRDEESE